MIDKIYKFLEGWQFDTFYVALGLFAMEWLFILGQQPGHLVGTYDSLVFYSPIWGPPFLLIPLWSFWREYVQRLFRLQQPNVLLELRIPREQVKSPLSMELFFAAMQLTGGETTFINRNWEGKTRAEFSLELCSHEGSVHMYIRTRVAWRHIVENQLYAQFPGLEIVEVPDYTRMIDFDPETMNLWGCEYKKGKPDPIPLKSYVDFGLEKDPKEEFKVDPMSVLFENLAYLKKGEHMWVQLLIRGRKNDQQLGFWGITKYNKYKDDAQHEIKRLLKAAEDATGKADFNKLTQGQKFAIAAMERQLTKRTYEVGIRSMYFAKKEAFRGTMAPTLITFFHAFGAPDANEMNFLAGTRWLIKYDYPWQDYKDIRKKKDRVALFEHYRRRDYWIAPYSQDPMVLTTEELATIFHFPGEIMTTPSVQRVPSRRSGAPANLPV